MTEPALPIVGDRVFVTLVRPVFVMLSDQPTGIVAIDGEIVDVSAAFNVFRARRLLTFEERMIGNQQTRDYNKRSVPVFVTMRIDVSVMVNNIAGLVLLPKDAKK